MVLIQLRLWDYTVDEVNVFYPFLTIVSIRVGMVINFSFRQVVINYNIRDIMQAIRFSLYYQLKPYRRNHRN